MTVPETVMTQGCEHAADEVVVATVVVAEGLNVTVARTPDKTTLASLVNVTIICWPVPVRGPGTVEPLPCSRRGELLVAPLYTV